jgi:hypothetical protein
MSTKQKSRPLKVNDSATRDNEIWDVMDDHMKVAEILTTDLSPELRRGLTILNALLTSKLKELKVINE